MVERTWSADMFGGWLVVDLVGLGCVVVGSRSYVEVAGISNDKEMEVGSGGRKCSC